MSIGRKRSIEEMMSWSRHFVHGYEPFVLWEWIVSEYMTILPANDPISVLISVKMVNQLRERDRCLCRDNDIELWAFLQALFCHYICMRPTKHTQYRRIEHFCLLTECIDLLNDRCHCREADDISVPTESGELLGIIWIGINEVLDVVPLLFYVCSEEQETTRVG
jgi:hypothetical protein